MRTFLAGLALTLALIGCTGVIGPPEPGPADPNDPNPPNPTIQTTLPPPADADIAAQEARLLELVNADRANSGRACAAPLALHDVASAVARGHSDWMAATGTLAHDDPDGNPFDRLGA